MPSYEYKVVPFVTTVKSRDRRSVETVAGELQTLINEGVQAGWEFYRIDQVQIDVNPGCMAALFGARATTVALDNVTFRREAAAS